ncbi:MAG TPA: CHAT domain-containing protein [Ktedonobacteraceae bacterium]|nr:CHAT domain-containing protein [Ktedonobacteraceae bacterium]
MESLELTITVQDDRRVQARLQDGSETDGQFILDPLHRNLINLFKDWLNEGKITKRKELEIFGTLLYRALFDRDVEGFFEECQAKADNSMQRLRVQLSFAQKVGDLASIPWEYLYYPDTERRVGFFLSTNVHLVLSRYMPLATRRQALAPGESPLRILFVVSQPEDLGPVIGDGVIEAIQDIKQAYPIHIEELPLPTIDAFLEKIEESKPHVLHFIGHGQIDTTSGRAEIALLADDKRHVSWVRDDEFAEYFVQMRSIPRLIFLQQCEGGFSNFSANYGGLTPQLIRAGVQAIVAMQYPISNSAAIIFSRNFYGELAKGEPVDNAVQSGRWRITTQISKAYNNGVFGTPVLYMRSRDGVIRPPDKTAAGS